MLEEIVAKVAEEGPTAMSLVIPYDEKALLESQQEYIRHTLAGTSKLHVFLADDETAPGPAAKKQMAVPMKPAFHFSGEGDEQNPAAGNKKGQAASGKPKGKPAPAKKDNKEKQKEENSADN